MLSKMNKEGVRKNILVIHPSKEHGKEKKRNEW